MIMIFIYNFMKFISINDIEVKYNLFFSESLKTEVVTKIFLDIFNNGTYTNLFLDDDPQFELSIDYGILLQIIGIYYNLIKNDKETAKKYLLKAVEKGNMNAYCSLYNNTTDNIEKLKYMLKLYDLDNNNISACINLGIYYMSNVIDEEKMFYYANKAIEQKSGEAMNNLGVYYMNKKDYPNAKKYFDMAIEHGYKAYYNLYMYAYETENKKLCKKCEFYLSVFFPEKMIELYEQILIDTEEKEIYCKLNYYKIYGDDYIDYLDHKEKINNYFLKMINYYKICVKNKYLPNTNLLIGDLIGKEKLEEFAEMASEGQKIDETIHLTNGTEMIFCYKKN